MRRLYVFGLAIGASLALLICIYFLYPTAVYLLNLNRIEVIYAKWGNMVHRRTEPETARWINFTLFNHGPERNDSRVNELPIFKLEIWEGDDYHSFQSIRYELSHGQNEMLVIGDIRFKEYRLSLEGRVLWQGQPTED